MTGPLSAQDFEAWMPEGERDGLEEAAGTEAMEAQAPAAGEVAAGATEAAGAATPGGPVTASDPGTGDGMS